MKKIVSILLTFVLFLGLAGCAGKDMSINEAVEEYGWTNSDVWNFCKSHLGSVALLEEVGNTYSPTDILRYLPYSDSDMADIALELYYDEITEKLNYTALNDELSFLDCFSVIYVDDGSGLYHDDYLCEKICVAIDDDWLPLYTGDFQILGISMASVFGLNACDLCAQVTKEMLESVAPSTGNTNQTYGSNKSSNEQVSYTVYITETGSKYHSYGCQYLRQSCYSIALNDALNRGYSACSKCW